MRHCKNCRRYFKSYLHINNTYVSEILIQIHLYLCVCSLPSEANCPSPLTLSRLQAFLPSVALGGIAPRIGYLKHFRGHHDVLLHGCGEGSVLHEAGFSLFFISFGERLVSSLSVLIVWVALTPRFIYERVI